MPALFRRRAATAALPAGKAGAHPVLAPAYAGEGFAPAGWAVPAGTVRFQYPYRFWLPLRLVGYALIALALLNLWQAFSELMVRGSFLSQYGALVLISALAGLLCSVVAGALIAGALPSFEIRAEGLAVAEFVRWRVLPWARIARLHSCALPGERYLVFVEYAGTSLSPAHLIYSLLAGLGRKPGVFYTSDIKDFDDLTRLILDARMRATPGLRAEDLLLEGVPMPVVQMAFDPRGTLASVAHLGDAGPQALPEERTTHVPTPRATLIRRQAALAAIPAVLFVVDNLVNGGIPFLGNNTWSFLSGLVGLLVIGLLELPFVALAIQALGENLLGNGEVQIALDTYPYLEMPRVLGFVGLLALVVIKAPVFLIFLGWLAILGYTAYLTWGFTERLYRINQNQAALAAGASALGQFFVLLAYMMLRAPGLG